MILIDNILIITLVIVHGGHIYFFFAHIWLIKHTIFVISQLKSFFYLPLIVFKKMKKSKKKDPALKSPWPNVIISSFCFTEITNIIATDQSLKIQCLIYRQTVI